MNKMTNSDYHAHPAVSKSDLDLIHRSPMHYLYRKEHPQKPTLALITGSVVHKMVLEPETFADEYIIAPTLDRRTRAGKEEWAAFEQEAAGRTIITGDMLTLAENIAEAVSHHKTARALLTGGKAETSHFWTDVRTGMECKCRPDYLRAGGFCVDFKTTQDASPEAFERAAYNYRYHVQAYWYLEGLKNCGGLADSFVFIAAEKEPPYAVAVYYADELMLRLGEQEARADLELLAKCRSTNLYHGYSESIQPMSLPRWAAREVM